MYPMPFTDFVLLLFLDIWAFFTLANAKILNGQVITVAGGVFYDLDHGVNELVRLGRQCYPNESKHPTMVILYVLDRGIDFHSARPILDRSF